MGGHCVSQFQSGKISGRDGRRIYIMEQMRIFNRPQNSGIVLTGLGTLLVLILSFQLSVQPTQAALSGNYRQLLSLQPHELLNLYYNRAPSYKPAQRNFIWQKRGPGSEFLGKRGGGYRGNSRSKRVPGSEFLGKRVPGSEFLGKRVPGSEFLGKRVPGSEFLGKRVPGSEFLGKRVPGSEFLGKRVPGSEFLGKRVPGSEFLGKRVPGSEFLGKRVPGSEFLGKRNMEDEENLNELINMVKRSPESAADIGIQSDRNAFEAALENN